MEKQRARAKASWKGAHKEAASPVYRKLAETFSTEPDFYFETTTRDCHIEAIVTKSGEVKELKAGEEAEVVLDRTTIYGVRRADCRHRRSLRQRHCAASRRSERRVLPR